MSIDGRRSLDETLIVSAEVQRIKLRSRLAYHRANPDEPESSARIG